MSILSVIVPSYNSECYLSKCIGTLVESGNDIEVIIVNDGSTDGTAALADRLAEQYAPAVRVVHQVNKGHGGAVNTGIASATGKYIKVVDSDDWVNPTALRRVVDKLKAFEEMNCRIDMFLCDFVYDKV